MAEIKLEKIEYDSITDVGSRSKNQDRHVISDNFFDEEQSYMFLVLDGHGDVGGAVADFVLHRLPSALKAVGAAKFDDDPKGSLETVFLDVQKDLETESGIDLYISGTTAALVLIRRGRLIAANIGDSRIVLGQKRSSDEGKFKAVELSRDHLWKDAEEAQRAQEAGGRLASEQADAPLRVYKGTLPYPGLVVSRSFGDEVAQRLGVTPLPTVTIHPLEPRDTFVILASDGLWDTITSKGSIKMVSKVDSVQAACNELKIRAGTISEADNVTIIVIKLTVTGPEPVDQEPDPTNAPEGDGQ